MKKQNREEALQLEVRQLKMQASMLEKENEIIKQHCDNLVEELIRLQEISVELMNEVTKTSGKDQDKGKKDSHFQVNYKCQ